ncbi:hypothetical protein Lsan_4126 [Legionella santicrucis]|uniref:Uncharacterized protein n=1 Tax=Legionella santicrucis TaxID=45074 RepID=A0A0W0YAP5_9GAMM|nr:hypothetical protein [Legionella santicrucis]KTD53716.1 hypothetical protein Lsan_4126 [Legionella santicrucis]
MPHIIQNHSGFIYFYEQAYYERVRTAINVKDEKIDTKKLSPKILEESPYKLHVSLDFNSFHTHAVELKKILIHYLEENTISSFKIVDWEGQESVLKTLQKQLGLLHELKVLRSCHHAKGNDILYQQAHYNWKCSYLRCLGLPLNIASFWEVSDQNLDGLTKIIETQIDSITRFKMNGQFTIYIKEHFNKESLRDLCHELHDYLNTNSVAPGQLLDVQTAITPHISLRQEYLIQDFNSFCSQGATEPEKRINSVPHIHTEEEYRKRVQVANEQKNSALYVYLKNGFINTTGLDSFSLFSAEKTGGSKQISVPQETSVPLCHN